MIPPATYSRKTVCPECSMRVRLEDVRFTDKFLCPHCRKEIMVSKRYSRAVLWLPWIPGLLIPYLIGVRGWSLLLWWIVCTIAISFVWKYAGKYLFPPKLEKYSVEDSPFQGLGLGR